ncbi:hypothetical protein OS493_023838 [Desmophyllum pertusum]|uniref:Uncharacterized protein n=1 Tax=Desmophyllum pertusum TaxID=174260 RepID=A0A9W9YLZ2_9CNID|nr:hypothetical protein OS493_023838 [Desmophyllum pertusum]
MYLSDRVPVPPVTFVIKTTNTNTQQTSEGTQPTSTRYPASQGRSEGSSSSISPVGVALGSFFGGVVVTVLIVLLVVFLKRRNNNKNRIAILPMTVRNGTTNGRVAPEGSEAVLPRTPRNGTTNAQAAPANSENVLPRTARNGTTNARVAPENSEANSNRRPQKDDNISPGEILSLCMPCTTCTLL